MVLGLLPGELPVTKARSPSGAVADRGAVGDGVAGDIDLRGVGADRYPISGGVLRGVPVARYPGRGPGCGIVGDRGELVLAGGGRAEAGDVDPGAVRADREIFRKGEAAGDRPL